MDQLREVLRQVQQGKKSFSPEASTPEGVKAFQPTAAAIKHASDLRYLSAVFRQSKMIGTHGCILQAVITSPLSYTGTQFLASLHGAQDQPKSTDAEVFQFKPSFWGMSIDLKALYKKLTRRRDQRGGGSGTIRQQPRTTTISR